MYQGHYNKTTLIVCSLLVTVRSCIFNCSRITILSVQTDNTLAQCTYKSYVQCKLPKKKEKKKLLLYQQIKDALSYRSLPSLEKKSTKCFCQTFTSKYFLKKKSYLPKNKCSFFFFLTTANLCCSWSAGLIELKNQCITQVSLLLLVLHRCQQTFSRIPSFNLSQVCLTWTHLLPFFF